MFPFQCSLKVKMQMLIFLLVSSLIYSTSGEIKPNLKLKNKLPHAQYVINVERLKYLEKTKLWTKYTKQKRTGKEMKNTHTRKEWKARESNLLYSSQENKKKKIRKLKHQETRRKVKSKIGKKKNKSSKLENKMKMEGRACSFDLPTLSGIFRKYIKYKNTFLSLNRITSWIRIAGNKKIKSATQFNDALDAMEKSTVGGTMCPGNPVLLGEAKKAYTTLRLCASTASQKCTWDDSDTLGLVTDCQTQIRNYLNKFKVCEEPVPKVDLKCDIDFRPIEVEVKAKVRIGCIDEDDVSPGSFGDCSRNQKAAAYLAVQCFLCNSLPTTQAPVGKHNLKKMINKSFSKKP